MMHGNATPRYFDQGMEAVRLVAPIAAEKLMHADTAWAEELPEVECQKLGLLCRDAIIAFADAVYSPDFALELGVDQPKRDAANLKVKLSVRYLKRFEESESARELLKSAWSYALGTQHSIDSSPFRAQRAIVFTMSGLIEVAHLVIEAIPFLDLYKKYGRYKCSICGRMTLKQESWHDGTSGGTFLVCFGCGGIDV